ncbi:hypothetical protein AB0L99_25745 [Streptomyces sp. NPDC051954]|uniref:hypothetical protein n=1 Tax=unclassified Streptomyces TaxID=2593676 RepID=UPI003443B7F5
MKIIAAAALAGVALLTSAVPVSADDGPLDFGIFQGVNDTKGSSGFTDSRQSWEQGHGDTSGTVPESALSMLVDNLTSPGGR